MTAREKFTIGDHVRLSPAGIGHNLSRSLMKHAKGLGVVTGFSHNGVSVMIRPDTFKCAQSFHMDFWEPITAQEAKP